MILYVICISQYVYIWYCTSPDHSRGQSKHGQNKGMFFGQRRLFSHSIRSAPAKRVLSLTGI